MRIDPADLAESIGTLADLNADGGLARGLDRVVAAATTLFGADTAGLMLLAKDGSLAAASAFDQQGELAELAQAQLGQGPCMDAFTRAVPVAIPDLRADPRFDQIAFVLRSAGIRGALCVPVEVLGGPIGTLDLFTAIPRAWDDSEVAAAHAYAGVVASLLGSAVAAHASSRLARQLQTALDSRVLIEHAKNVPTTTEKVDAQTANKEPASIIAAQLRHADGGALAQRVYIHQLPQTAPRLAEVIEGVFGPEARDELVVSAGRRAEGKGRETRPSSST